MSDEATKQAKPRRRHQVKRHRNMRYLLISGRRIEEVFIRGALLVNGTRQYIIEIGKTISKL